jgi:hypothetical protein
MTIVSQPVFTLEQCRRIAEMRKTDYFCDQESADAIEWLITEVEHYRDKLLRAIGSQVEIDKC